jgi:hypothetical protein
LFFAISADGGVSPASTTLRDYAVFQGKGSGIIPAMLITNTMTFGPTPPLGARFDASDPGVVTLFPVRSIAGWGNTPAGSAGLQWLSVEVRQVNNLITCLLNGTAIVQYTNTTTYTNGTVMIGYGDLFSSIGDANSFAVFDNLRVEKLVIAPVQLLSPVVNGNQFSFSFATEPYESYTAQRATSLSPPDWANYTNFVGNGGLRVIVAPLPSNGSAQQYFRVSRP